MAATRESTRLEIVGPEGVPAYHELEAPPYVLGRSADTDIRLNAANVSRRHAEILRDPFGRWWLRDLGSHNGTFVNGEAIDERPLRADEEARIGDFHLRLHPAAATPEHADTAPAGVVAETKPDEGALSSLAQLSPPHVSTAHLVTLARFGTGLLEIETAEKRLEALCDLVIGDDFHGRAAMVLRLDQTGSTDRPKVVTTLRLRSDESEEDFHLSRTLLEATRAGEDAVLATNMQAGEGEEAIELSIGAPTLPMAAVACPVHRDEEAVDVLYASFAPEYGTGEWLALIDLAVRQYQQAELAWAGRRRAERLAAIENELEQARQLQVGLVPGQRRIEGLDTGIGFEPCHGVGGDYADIVTLPDGRVLVAVADVCGKGLRAALTTSCVHTMVHAAARAGTPLPELMWRLNDHLCETLAEHHFVTMLALAVAPEDGAIECVNAGHLPAFVVDGAASLRRIEGAQNLPLGVVPGELDPGAPDVLGPGDWLTLYTDGLSELPMPEGGMLGVEGLAERVREACRNAGNGASTAKGVADELMRQVHAIQGERAAGDDYTVLVARRV